MTMSLPHRDRKAAYFVACRASAITLPASCAMLVTSGSRLQPEA